MRSFDVHTIFEGWSWFKFHNLALALGIAFKFYTSGAKKVETKSENVLKGNTYVCKSYRGKTGGKGFFATIPNRI